MDERSSGNGSWREAVLGLGLVCSLVAGAQAGTPTFGVGASAQADARTAGAEAARKAKAALNGAAPQAVVVFAARAQVSEAMVEGVAESFDRALVYGCEGYSPLTPEGNFSDQGHTIKNGVAVLAIAGADAVHAVSAGTQGEGRWEACGRSIGGQLKPVLGPGGDGCLILTFGDQHVGQNGPFLKGLFSVIDPATPVAGAAAGGSDAKEIVAGQIVQGVNVALLIRGSFSVRLACNGGADGDLVAKAHRSFESVLAGSRDTVRMVFAFDCGGRRGNLAKAGKLAAEYEAMKSLAGPVPFFGFYGGGEIGAAKSGEPAQGVGFSIATVAVVGK